MVGTSPLSKLGWDIVLETIHRALHLKMELFWRKSSICEESECGSPFLSPPWIWRRRATWLLRSYRVVFWSHLAKTMLSKKGMSQTSFHLENHHLALRAKEEARGSINLLLMISSPWQICSMEAWPTNFSGSFVAVSKQEKTNVLLVTS